MRTSKIQLAAILIAATFATGAALAANNDLEVRFVQYDLDSDGFIALSEWKGGAGTFDSLDRDGDAVVTRNEFFYQGVRYQTREERFRELDADQNGRLSADEWKWGAETLAVLDRDRDGSLTPKEFGCRARGRRAARTGAEPGQTARP